MRLLTLNCNGIRAAAKKGLAEYLNQAAADVICLQEVRATRPQIPPPFDQWPGWWLPAEKAGYSGVGVLTPQPVREHADGLGDPEFDREGRVQRLDLADLTLINVYIPSGSSSPDRQSAKMRFLQRFQEYVAQLLKERGQVVICGDFNIAHQPIDLKNWRSNQEQSGFLPEERAWLSDFASLGLVDVVRQLAGPDTAVYSWWSQRSGARLRDVGWRLDYHWATPELAARASRFQIPRLPVYSDHAPVVVDYLGI